MFTNQKRCAVKGCFTQSQGPSNLSFYRAFAKKRNFLAWKSFSKSDNFTNNSFVCEIHFETSQFRNNQNRSQGLIPYAVPTLHGPMEVSFDEADFDQPAEYDLEEPSQSSVFSSFLENENSDAETFLADDQIAGEVVIEAEETISESEPSIQLSTWNHQISQRIPAIANDHSYQVNPEFAVMMAERLIECEAEITELKAKLRKKDNNLVKKNNVIKDLRKTIQLLKQSCNIPDHGLNDPLLMEMQRNKNRKLNGARYSDNLKNMALVLHYCSPKAYKQMRKYFSLPSISTIKTWLARIDIKDGFSSNILKLLKIKAGCLEENEKFVTLFLDEISLTERVSYFSNAKPDYFVGFGTKIPGQKKINVKQRANSSLTLMIKTIRSGFKQSIGYFFCKNANSRQLRDIVDQALVEIKGTGFIPKVICCDQNSTNRALYEKEYNVTESKPYIVREYGKVYCLFDAPHLLKSTRNNLLKHNCVYKGGLCSFEHIKKLYFEDIKTQPRSVPRLKHEHISLAQFAEMSVSKAANVLSQSVATGLETFVTSGKLPQAALNTSLYCRDFDTLFDIANSSVFSETKECKRPIQSNSTHLMFLQQMREPIRQMYFVNKRCTALEEEKNFKPLVKQSRKAYFIDGWLLYISALLELWEELSSVHRFDHLRTRNLQQDCLEHFFSLIRWKNVNNNHPDPARYMSAYKSIVLNQLMVPNKLGNVEADVSRYILNSEELKTIDFVKAHSSRVRQYNVDYDQEKADSTEFDENELSSIYSTTGWVCSQINHKECISRVSLGNNNLPDKVKILSESKKYNNAELVSPSEQVLEYFQIITKIFDQCFLPLLEESPIGVKQELIDIIRDEFNYPSQFEEIADDALVYDVFCERCALKVTDNYLDTLIREQLSSLNITFKTDAEEKKMAKRNQKSKKLNITKTSSIC